jgi:hypothetical protein
MKKWILLLGLSLVAGCASNRSDDVMHVVNSPFKCRWLEHDIHYLVERDDATTTNQFFVSPTEVRDGKLLRAVVYWKERRTLLLYEARLDEVDGASMRDCSTFSWWCEWPLVSGTIDPEDSTMVCGRDAPLHLDTWVMWQKECVQRGQLYTVMKGQAEPSTEGDGLKPAF